MHDATTAYFSSRWVIDGVKGSPPTGSYQPQSLDVILHTLQGNTISVNGVWNAGRRPWHYLRDHVLRVCNSMPQNQNLGQSSHLRQAVHVARFGFFTHERVIMMGSESKTSVMSFS